MNLSGYVRRATIFSWVLTTAYCLVVGLGLSVGVRIRFSGVWMVGGYAHVFAPLSVAIVTLPSVGD